VQFGQLFSTMMAGSEPAMQLEQEFLAAIAVPLQLSAQGDQLILTGDKGVIVLKASAQPAATPKSGGSTLLFLQCLLPGRRRHRFSANVAPQARSGQPTSWRVEIEDIFDRVIGQAE
jgi:hypothetical protein